MRYKILFAGGRHVNGEAAGGDSKLSSVALRLLRRQGIEGDAGYLVPVRLSHPRRLAQKCAAFRPDVLVLQPELGRSANSHIFAERAADTFDGAWTTEVKWLLRSCGRRLLNALTGYRLVNLRRLSASVDRFFACVAALGVPHVIVLSPLPCADPIVLHYRRKLAPMLRHAAEQHGYPYLDVIGMDARSLFLNPYELNQAGHQLIGQMTAEFIDSAVWPHAGLAVQNSNIMPAAGSTGNMLLNDR